MARENKVPLRTILTIIAVASGGPDIANSDRDMSRPVNLLIDFLIKAGGCVQISSEYPASPQHPDDPKHSGIALSEASAAVPLTMDRSSANTGARTEQLDIAEPVVNGPTDRSTHDYADTPSTLTESLTRLELNSLQLKHYLDSIDQRISRMEPRLENVPALTFSNAANHPKEKTEAKFSAAIPSQASQSLNDPLRPAEPHPEPARHEKLLAHLRTTSMNLPSSRGPISIRTLLGLAALLLCALFLWSFGHRTTHANVHPANVAGDETMNADSLSLPPSATAHDPSAKTTTLPPGNTSQAISAPAGTANGPTKNSAAIPFSHTPTSPPLTAKEVPPSAIFADASHPPDTSNTNPTRPYGYTPTSLSGSLVNVSSGVMAANLVAAPMPAYPKLASITHMQGNVVMQAVISKSGTVESVHVIKGHRLLRGAATNAVRAWRYRPYLINGRPVEVATIVSIDFTLKH
jgi:TonB family protein